MVRRCPRLVYFHGGGFVVANAKTYDASCAGPGGYRRLRRHLDRITASAPENKFPACAGGRLRGHPVHHQPTPRVYNIDPQKVAVGGESAGGNLATVVCLMAKERKGVDACPPVAHLSGDRLEEPAPLTHGVRRVARTAREKPAVVCGHVLREPGRRQEAAGFTDLLSR